MNAKAIAKIALALAVLCAALPAPAQTASLAPRATKVGTRSVTIAWNQDGGTNPYYIRYNDARTSNYKVVTTSGLSVTVTGLKPNTNYQFDVESNLDYATIYVRTKASDPHDDGADQAESDYTPPDVTCPYLPARVVVRGYARHTQCQMVDEAHIGRLNLIERGFVDAVDVWSYVNGGLEVCFRNDGWLVFLDATYLLRMQVELEHYYRDGMICGAIDRIGTVVLVSSPPPLPTLPTFEALPLADCQIKLVETLFLRATPGGEIIGLVWLNSEVPAFEMSGNWYKVEFEGAIGYISRFYRKVLRGGCG